LEKLYAKWRIRAFVIDEITGAGAETRCFIAQAQSVSGHPPLVLCDLDSIDPAELSATERTAASSAMDTGQRKPLGHLGWIEDVRRWVQTVAGGNLCALENITQIAAGRNVAILRFRYAEGGVFWLKAVPETHIHERAITQLLSEAGVPGMPKVVAVNADWNAWLVKSTEDARVLEDVCEKHLLASLEFSARDIAVLQLSTIVQVPPLLLAGAFDQRISTLEARSRGLFAKVEEAMGYQTSERVRRLETDELQLIRKHLELSYRRIEDAGIPCTLLHGDVNLGNISISGHSCVFLDWCEAYIGFPFATLEHLLFLIPATLDHVLAAEVRRKLIRRYSDVFEGLCTKESLHVAIELMPLLGAASAMYGRGDWMETSLFNQPLRAGRLRTIARHMFEIVSKRPEDLLAIF
jgi:hypothetical protein